MVTQCILDAQCTHLCMVGVLLAQPQSGQIGDEPVGRRRLWEVCWQSHLDQGPISAPVQGQANWEKHTWAIGQQTLPLFGLGD